MALKKQYYNNKITLRYLTEEHRPFHNLYLYNRESSYILNTVSDIIVCITSKDKYIITKIKSFTDKQISIFIL